MSSLLSTQHSHIHTVMHSGRFRFRSWKTPATFCANMSCKLVSLAARCWSTSVFPSNSNGDVRQVGGEKWLMGLQGRSRPHISVRLACASHDRLLRCVDSEWPREIASITSHHLICSTWGGRQTHFQTSAATKRPANTFLEAEFTSNPLLGQQK